MSHIFYTYESQFCFNALIAMMTDRNFFSFLPGDLRTKWNMFAGYSTCEELNLSRRPFWEMRIWKHYPGHLIIRSSQSC